MKYEDLLKNLIDANENIIIMTAENRAALRNIPTTIPNNFLDFGISEMTMVGAAAGLAVRGRIPIIHALAMFLTGRAYEFIRTDVGILGLPVKIVGAVPGFLSTGNGPTHQAIEDIGLMAGIPNVCVFCPSDNEDMIICLPQIINDNRPFYIRFNDSLPIIEHDKNFEIGKSELVCDGNNITIMTYGILLKQALESKVILNNYGFSVRILNMRTLKPIDIDAIHRAALETQLIVTLEDHLISSGLFSMVSQILSVNKHNCKLHPIGLTKWFKPAGDINAIIDYEGFGSKEIAHKIMNCFK